MRGEVALGLQEKSSAATLYPAAVIAVQNLQAMFAAVQTPGGKITKPTLPFPAGRRFRRLDPHGNELAARKETAAQYIWRAFDFQGPRL